MDTLAAYGSSSSESGCSDNDAGAGAAAAAANDKTANGSRKRPRPQDDNNDGGGGACSGDEGDGHAVRVTPSATSSSRGNSKTTKDSARILPPPPLTKDFQDSSSSCMICWPEDYISQRHATDIQQASSVLLFGSRGEDKGKPAAAEALRSDPNFTNPHQFGAAMEELGIIDAMGSTFIIDDGDEPEDWELTDLERLEMEARRRKQHECQQQQQQQGQDPQQQQPSQFAQEQLERALQRSRPF